MATFITLGDSDSEENASPVSSGDSSRNKDTLISVDVLDKDAKAKVDDDESMAKYRHRFVEPKKTYAELLMSTGRKKRSEEEREQRRAMREGRSTLTALDDFDDDDFDGEGALSSTRPRLGDMSRRRQGRSWLQKLMRKPAKMLSKSDVLDDELSEGEDGIWYDEGKGGDGGSGSTTTLKQRRRKIAWKQLRKLAYAQRWLLFWGIIALIIAASTNLAIPFYVGKIIDAVSREKSSSKLGSAVVGMVVFTTLAAVFTLVRNTLFTVAGERVVRDLRRQLFTSLTTQEIGFFDGTRTGDLVNRLSSDATTVTDVVTVNISMGLRYFGQLVGGFVFLFVISWKLTMVMLSVLPIIACIAISYGRTIRKLSREVQDALAKSNEVATEVIQTVRTVRSFSHEVEECDKYGVCVEESYRLAKKRAIVRGVFGGGTTWIGGMAVVLVLWNGGTLVVNGDMSPGKLTSFILYTLGVSVALGVLAELFGQIMKGIGASERVFELIARKPKVRFRGGQHFRNARHEASTIEFSQVSFRYPTRRDIEVLKDFSLKIEPGKVIALCGASGGGKSTCIALLLGFYYCSKGKITIDGVDLKDIDPHALRTRIATVRQEPDLFAMTIAENIAYGSTDAKVPFAKIIRAAKLANAHEFIKQFPEQYDTVVGERGLRLSGGQKQRIAIARALLKDPQILLLDEATSALDAESEHLVKQALDKLMQGRTVLVIAHRLSTVRNADTVVVLDHGRVVERGTHDELLAIDGGAYKNLVDKQLLV